MGILRRVREISVVLSQVLNKLNQAETAFLRIEEIADRVQPKLDKAIESAKELNVLLAKEGEDEGESLEAETAAKEGLLTEIERIEDLANPQ